MQIVAAAIAVDVQHLAAGEHAGGEPAFKRVGAEFCRPDAIVCGSSSVSGTPPAVTCAAEKSFVPVMSNLQPLRREASFLSCGALIFTAGSLCAMPATPTSM